MLQNWWEQYPEKDAAPEYDPPYRIKGNPRQPAPQTAPQQRKDVLDVTKTEADLADRPLRNEATRVSIEQSRNSVSNARFDNVNNLRKQFEAEKSVQDYKIVLPLMDNAFKLGPNKAGDLNLVYAFGKTMDPGSVVREGEQVMATNVGGVSEKVKGFLDQINGGAGLTPVQRTQLTEEIRNRARSLNETYNQRRAFYKDFAERNGIRAEDVVGPHPGAPFMSDEEGYIRAHGGEPKGAGPEAPDRPQGRFGDGFGTPGTEVQFNDKADTRTRARRFHDDLYNALSAKNLKSPADVNAWVQQFNQENSTGFSINWKHPDTRKAIANALRGGRFNVETPTDPRVQRKIDQFMQNGGGASEAAVAGGADAITVGALPRLGAGIEALGQSLGGEGSFSDLYNVNLDANRGYLDQLQQDHPYAHLGGTLVGGLALPGFGAKSAAELARVGAGYGGLYGLNQGDSSTTLAERAGNTALGASTGAVAGYAIPKGLDLAGDILAKAPRTLPRFTDGTERSLERQKQVDASKAASDLGIDMPRYVAGGPTAQRLGALADQSQVGAPTIRRASNLMLNQSEAARDEIAGRAGGRVLDQESMGERAISGASKSRQAIKGGYRRFYEVAERLSGDVRVPLPTARQATLAQVAELSDTPGGVEPKILGTLQDIGKNLDGDWSPAGIRRMRTQLRDRFVESGLDQGDASRRAQIITQAAEQDMISGLRASGRGDAATAWQKASQARAAYQQQVDNVFAPILGINKDKTGPEVASALRQAVRNNPGRFRQFVSSLPPEDANDVRASIIGQMGNPGSGRQDAEGKAFSLATFLTHWNDLKGVREQVFDQLTVKALNRLALVAERAKTAGRVENHYNTGSIAIGMMTAGPASAAPVLLASGQAKEAAIAMLTSISLGLAQHGGARLLASPKFAQRLAQTPANPKAASRFWSGQWVKRLAATNPEIREPLIAFQQKLLSGSNDNFVPSVAASADPDEEQQKQYPY